MGDSGAGPHGGGCHTSGASDGGRRMYAGVRLVRLCELPASIEALRAEAVEEGLGFVERLCEEWRSGANRFDAPGEVLLGALIADALVGVGGLCRDPYLGDPCVGRLRHVFVTRSWRRRGVAAALVSRLLAEAEGCFGRLRLRTSNPLATALYEAHGFARVDEPDATHAIDLQRPGSSGPADQTEGSRPPAL